MKELVVEKNESLISLVLPEKVTKKLAKPIRMETYLCTRSVQTDT